VERRGVVAIGGSAGGIEALVELVGALPADLPACVLVTVHIGEQARSSLPQILTRSGPLTARHPRHGEPLRTGHIYVAPPGFHLLAAGGVARLSRGPRVNRHRPAVDVMFGSAARWAREQVVAVVLSGLLDDGAVGAALVARSGGRVVIQDPAEAGFDSMPRAALAGAPSAAVVPSGQLGRTVVAMVGRGEPEGAADGKHAGSEMPMVERGSPLFAAHDDARLTRLVCPECGGSLAEVQLPHIVYYRCYVGHQFGPKTLEAAQADAAERKLWTGVAALEDHAALARHLADQDDGYREVADQAAGLAKAMRAHLNAPGGRDARTSG
jgi:two-component system, chemotaxis family, protein-glutamate methylesterase/glutaminase